MQSSLQNGGDVIDMRNRRDPILTGPSVRWGLEQLREWLSVLEQTWLGESEADCAPILVGCVPLVSASQLGHPPASWLAIALEPDVETFCIGPFESLAEAMGFAVREHAVGIWHRMQSVDDYLGRAGLGHTKVPQTLLESFASDAYLPEQAPGKSWLLRSEEDRLSSIRLYHRLHSNLAADVQDGLKHAWLHFWAETALCANVEPAFAEAFASWRSRGLTRHEAVHALGECIAAQLEDARKGHIAEIEEYLVAIEPRHFRRGPN